MRGDNLLCSWPHFCLSSLKLWWRRERSFRLFELEFYFSLIKYLLETHALFNTPIFKKLNVSVGSFENRYFDIIKVLDFFLLDWLIFYLGLFDAIILEVTAEGYCLKRNRLFIFRVNSTEINFNLDLSLLAG